MSEMEGCELWLGNGEGYGILQEEGGGNTCLKTQLL